MSPRPPRDMPGSPTAEDLQRELRRIKNNHYSPSKEESKDKRLEHIEKLLKEILEKLNERK